MPRNPKATPHPPLPGSVRIAGINYVVEQERGSEALETKNSGRINHETATITLDQNEPDWRKRKVLLHELVHGIERHFGNGLEHTEEHTEALESGLWCVFNDNPGLARAIFGSNA